MYDPTIGRWISEDPLGFEAADPNLYRYAGNKASGDTDPSGLFTRQIQGIIQANGLDREIGRPVTPWNGTIEQDRIRFRQNLPLSDRFPVRIHFVEPCDTATGIAQRIIMRDAMSAAAVSVASARRALRDRWNEVQRDLRNNADMSVLFAQGANTAANRTYYLTALDQVYFRLVDSASVINLEIEPADPLTGSATCYVWRWVGDTIHIYPRFFREVTDVSGQGRTMVHELGRLIPGISGNEFAPSLSVNNIYNWREMIMTLAETYP